MLRTYSSTRMQRQPPARARSADGASIGHHLESPREYPLNAPHELLPDNTLVAGVEFLLALAVLAFLTIVQTIQQYAALPRLKKELRGWVSCGSLSTPEAAKVIPSSSFTFRIKSASSFA